MRGIEPFRPIQVWIFRLVNSAALVVFCFGSPSPSRTFVPAAPRMRPTHSVSPLPEVEISSIFCRMRLMIAPFRRRSGELQHLQVGPTGLSTLDLPPPVFSKQPPDRVLLPKA